LLIIANLSHIHHSKYQRGELCFINKTFLIDHIFAWLSRHIFVILVSCRTTEDCWPFWPLVPFYVGKSVRESDEAINSCMQGWMPFLHDEYPEIWYDHFQPTSSFL